MKSNKTEQHKGKKKDNLGWKIIKLQAQVGETNSRKAMKAVEAERNKEVVSTSTTTTTTTTTASSSSSSSSLISTTTIATTTAVTEELLKLKEQKISQKIYHAKKEVKKTFVKAKTFETQRLIKRLKEARKTIENNGEEATDDMNPASKKKQDFTEEDIAKFEHELELVKTLDMDSLSEHAFISKLSKHPTLRKHPLLVPYVEAKTTTEKTNGDSKKISSSSSKDTVLIQSIESRLINTKTVKDYMVKLWQQLEHIVSGKKATDQHVDLMEKKRKADDDHEEQENKKQKTETRKDIKSQHEIEHSSDNSDNNSSSDDNDDDDDGNNDDDDDDDDDSDNALAEDMSDSEYDDGYDSDGQPLPKSRKNGKASITSSMFIGSLNEGGGQFQKNNKKEKKRDKNDWVDDKFDEIYGMIKKNRPGQRARRMKAELKYGEGANHVKKAAEEARVQKEKKTARKAKQEQFKASRDASSTNTQKLPTNINNNNTSNNNNNNKQISIGAGNRPAAAVLVDPTLHPSWIAKQSEKAAIAVALSSARSNRIVFEDSD
ncbi:hypothetical protein BGZ65_005934 [Modicella reniformis]|uniref:Bud22 domain-containing protein n=1 Tax=Modicella reniformis TaxID=1440133 RepID=A0A9P6IYM9_9FUNG|nr:hypothetical protein BGZ65_005934 [Modicella reniformis]